MLVKPEHGVISLARWRHSHYRPQVTLFLLLPSGTYVKTHCCIDTEASVHVFPHSLTDHQSSVRSSGCLTMTVFLVPFLFCYLLKSADTMTGKFSSFTPRHPVLKHIKHISNVCSGLDIKMFCCLFGLHDKNWQTALPLVQKHQRDLLKYRCGDFHRILLYHV